MNNRVLQACVVRPLVEQRASRRRRTQRCCTPVSIIVASSTKSRLAYMSALKAAPDDLHEVMETMEHEKFATSSGVVEAVEEGVAEVIRPPKIEQIFPLLCTISPFFQTRASQHAGGFHGRIHRRKFASGVPSCLGRDNQRLGPQPAERYTQHAIC